MELTLSGISQDAKEATITIWHNRQGDNVSRGEDLLEVVTDKATFDVPCPCNGVLGSIKRRAGETVRTDEVVAVILEQE
ncbi:MAG: hypothetical protein GF409_02090 [Candidatus Omnitrophica bacterium]|nr:hypothetical protein [Candidatus Omnitrophota bacterium]